MPDKNKPGDTSLESSLCRPNMSPSTKSHCTDKLMSLQMLSQSGPQSSHKEFMNLNFREFYHTQTST